MIAVNEPQLAGREADYVTDCVRSGWISSAGGDIDRFENEWAAHCGRNHGVAVGNGTTALEPAVSALDLARWAEVILPPFTIVSTLEGVLRNGLTPGRTYRDPLDAVFLHAGIELLAARSAVEVVAQPAP